MILSLIFGLLRMPAWSPLIAVAVAFGFELFVFGPQRNAWRVDMGLPADGPEAIILGLVIAIPLHFAAYLLGRGVRWIFDRLRAG